MERTPARTLALWCPDWPVTAAGADLDAPVAVLEGEGARRVVAACSPAAREQGVRRGQRVRDAQRLCPRILLYPRDEAGEARAFEAVAAVAEDLAAAIEIVRPGLIVFDARGPARYHGGEPRLAALVRDAVAELEGPSGEPLGCGVGIADGIFAAVLAARRPGGGTSDGGAAVIVGPGDSPAFLSPYPVGALDRPELAAALDRLGVRTLGAYAALPAADVADRFGADGALAHRLARGLDPRPPAPRRPGDDLTAVHEFDPPAERDEPVVFAAKALADRLHATLAASGLACVRLGVEITTASGRTSVRLWRHGDAAGGRLSGLAVAERVRWQLDGWRARFPQLPDNPDPDANVTAAQATAAAIAAANSAHGAVHDLAPDPVVLLRLVPDQLAVDTGSQLALWGREEVPRRVGRAAEHVQALLGHAAIARPRLTGARDPAGRVVTVPWGELPRPEADRHAPWPGSVPLPAPALVPPQPYPVELHDRAGQPVGVSGRARLTGEPAALTVQGHTLRVTAWAGPWIYDEHWWTPGGRRRRARLQCATEDGSAWLLAVEGGVWRVEGVHR